MGSRNISERAHTTPRAGGDRSPGEPAAIGAALRFPDAGDPAQLHGLAPAMRRTSRVTLLFPGPYGPSAAQAAMLAESLAALRWLDRLGITASAAVGYGAGEIAGLVWAGSLSAPEAARLVAQRGEVLSAMDALTTAMVRIAADEATVRALGSRPGLVIAAYEAPRSHVLAGPVRAVRDVARQAAGLGIAADVLDAPHALHSPVMAPCAAPLRSVLAHIRFAPPRRRLVSTVTAREVTPHDDIPSLLCAQLTSPVLFAEALRVATADADLLFVAGADVPLAASAAACCGLPVTGFPAGTYRSGGQQAAAPGRGTRAAPGPEPATLPAPIPQPVTPPAPAYGWGRFAETVTVLRPGAELVAKARISLGTDPYLADYLIGGRAVLPAAMGLEAMAQAASMLARQPLRRARSVSLGIPMAVADSEQAVLCVQARVRGDGAHVETVLRGRSGGRLTEYARAVFVGPGESREEARYPACPVDARAGSGLVPGAMTPFGTGPIAEDPRTADEPGLVGGAGVVDGADLYGPVCFQTGRFRRVALVCRTRPGSYRAVVRGADELPWFGHLPPSAGRLILGSPGLNDAALQVIQACVPHRRLSPAGCDVFTVSGTQVPGAVELHAFLRAAPSGAATGETSAGRDENETPAHWDEYVWDIHGYDATGQPVVTWLGLRMQDAGPLYPGRSEARAPSAQQ